ncbi:hypothetical protein [Robiginitomaculum antarcticum]|uniref:hypothetical protein n=1 Tax=Robiginitomaculum antarcticum TaxID=437507 RepID=UPI00035C1E27|nr:hypothetical protein [Robiginitomaculum antarcticum]
MHWFVQVSEQVYGPYDDHAMQGFVAEGRVTSQSRITNNPAGGFYDASAYDIFNFWAGTGQSQLSAASGQTAQLLSFSAKREISDAANESAQQQQPTPVKDTDNDATFIIMAEIRSTDAMTFLQIMQSFGRTERIGETLWALRSAASAEKLRNALSQTLGRQDRMFIVDSANNRTAWFNIGADLDKRIRDLWSED